MQYQDFSPHAYFNATFRHCPECKRDTLRIRLWAFRYQAERNKDTYQSESSTTLFEADDTDSPVMNITSGSNLGDEMGEDWRHRIPESPIIRDLDDFEFEEDENFATSHVRTLV